MCLAFLAPLGAIRLNLVYEQVWLDVGQGRLGAVGCCDIFFTAIEPVERIITLSPHLLYQNGVLGAAIEQVPGSGDGQFDNIYQRFGGAVCDFKAGTFCVPVESTVSTASSPIEHRGELIRPEISLPPEIANDPEAIELMAQIGTAIELRFDGMKPGTTYGLRLILRPHRLLIENQPKNIPDPVTGDEGALWEQSTKITSPQTLFSDTLQLLDKASNFDAGRHGAQVWKSLLQRQPLGCCSAQRNRIAFIFPDNATVERDHSVGNVMALGTSTVIMKGAGPRSLQQWDSGTDIYWTDSPRYVAERIFEYVSQWGGKLSKTKEDITTGLMANPLNLQHANSSLIVNKLAGFGSLKDVGDGHYTTGSTPLSEVIDRLATDQEVASKFTTTGFEIVLTVRFTYRSPEFERKLQDQKSNRERLDRLAEDADVIGKKALTWAKLGVLLAAISIIFAVPPLWDILMRKRAEQKVQPALEETDGGRSRQAQRAQPSRPASRPE